MKKLITIITIVVAIFGATMFANAATVLNNVGNISKIEARGNVEVIVANGDKDEVTVNNNYYAQNALVQGKDGVLRISSYGNEKLVVFVKAADLRSIAAFDNAVVKSDGRFVAIDLKVELSNNANATLNLNSYAANIIVNDNAKADVTGFANEFALNYSAGATVSHSGFVADNITEAKIAPAKVIAKAEQKADDEIAIVD